MKVNIEEYHRDSKVEVEIEDHDIWNLDYTLALIILPALKKLKEKKFGIPAVEICDAPSELFKEKDFPEFSDRNFGYSLKAWHYVLDQIIYSFEQILNPTDEDSCFQVNENEQDFLETDNPDFFEFNPKRLTLDSEKYEEFRKKKQKGLDLFGKYYQSLWT